MATEEELIARLQGQGDDAQSAQIYADWLDAQGRGEQAAFVRDHLSADRARILRAAMQRERFDPAWVARLPQRNRYIQLIRRLIDADESMISEERIEVEFLALESLDAELLRALRAVHAQEDFTEWFRPDGEPEPLDPELGEHVILLQGAFRLFAFLREEHLTEEQRSEFAGITPARPGPLAFSQLQQPAEIVGIVSFLDEDTTSGGYAGDDEHPDLPPPRVWMIGEDGSEPPVLDLRELQLDIA